jgi:hypothetical protein
MVEHYAIGEFLFPFPIIALMNEADLPRGDWTVTILSDAEGRRFIALFSDEDLARRFVQQIGKIDNSPAEIYEHAVFSRILTLAQKSGVTHVAFDPTLQPSAHSAHAFRATIQEVIDAFGRGPA